MRSVKGLSSEVCMMVPVCLLQVIRITGFMKGLYTDAEMKSDNVKVGLLGVPFLHTRAFKNTACFTLLCISCLC